MTIEFIRNLRAAITPFRFHKNSLDMDVQPTVLDHPPAFWTTAPTVIATTRHRKDPAHLLNTPLSAVLVYESEYLFGSSEKMATAFFKMSRSREDVHFHA